jgi:cytidine deaminase
MCRQTLAEFCEDDLVVVCDEGGEETTEYLLGDLLPNTISLGTLESAEGVDDSHPEPDDADDH